MNNTRTEVLLSLVADWRVQLTQAISYIDNYEEHPRDEQIFVLIAVCKRIAMCTEALETFFAVIPSLPQGGDNE